MSNIYKSNIYKTKVKLLIECAKAMRYRASTDHFVLGGMATIITELLFATYYVDDLYDPDTVYSDAKVVSAKVPDEYADIALDIVTYRNAFAHEFGTEYYDEMYLSITGRMAELVELVHHVGGMPSKAERAYLMEYYEVSLDKFYDKMEMVFMEKGPIGYMQLVNKLKRKK